MTKTVQTPRHRNSDGLTRPMRPLPTWARRSLVTLVAVLALGLVLLLAWSRIPQHSRLAANSAVVQNVFTAKPQPTPQRFSTVGPRVSCTAPATSSAAIWSSNDPTWDQFPGADWLKTTVPAINHTQRSVRLQWFVANHPGQPVASGHYALWLYGHVCALEPLLAQPAVRDGQSLVVLTAVAPSLPYVPWASIEPPRP